MVPLNLLVCPTLSTDPVTALDANHLLNAVVIGTTSGRVYAYKANHILDAIALTRPPDVTQQLKQSSYALPSFSNPSISTNSEALSLSAVIPGHNKGFPLRIDCNQVFPLVSIPPRFATKHVTCATCGLSVVEVQAPTNEASQRMKPLPLCRDCIKASGKKTSYQGSARPSSASQHGGEPTPSSSAHASADSGSRSRSGSGGNGCNDTPSNGLTGSYMDVSGDQAKCTETSVTASGKAIAAKPKSGKKGKELLIPVSPATFRCKLLTERADEGIRGIYIVPHSAVLPNPASPLKHGTVCMTVGDLMVRLSVSLRDRHCLNMKFQRRHDLSLCDGTYTLCHKQCSALISPDDPLNCVLLDTYKQKQFLLTGLSISPTAVPFGMDERNIGWHEVVTEPEMLTVVSIAALDTQKTTHNLYLSGVKKPLMLTLSGNRVVSVVNANTIEVHCLLSHEEATHTVRWYQDHDTHVQEEKERSRSRATRGGTGTSGGHGPGKGDAAEEKRQQDLNMRLGGLQPARMAVYDEDKSWREVEEAYSLYGYGFGYGGRGDGDGDGADASGAMNTPTSTTTGAGTSTGAVAVASAREQGLAARALSAGGLGPGVSSWCDELGRSTDKHKWGPRGSVLEVKRGSYRDAAKELLALSKRLRCVQFTAHSEGTILGLLVENNGEDIITLGSDRKLKVWHKGNLVVKYVNIKGTFISRLPVVMRRVGRVVYYTTDDAVYCVLLPMEVEDMQGNLTLEPFIRSKLK